MEGQDGSAGWVGTILSNRWRVEAKIARGGVATVFCASDLGNPGKRVAIKIMHAQFARNPDARGRFLREGYAANKVGHAGVVRILQDDVTPDGAPFIVMELLEDGELLEDRRIKLGGRLPFREVVLVCDQVLDVLIAAHGQGIIHRDIKPDNIFVLASGEVKVLDFGIAHIKEAALGREATATGLVLGTPEFMSPEQAQGKRGQIDAQTDVYAVGALMFTLVSGQAVHVDDVLSKLLLATANRQARSLSSARVKDIPQALITVVDKALALEKPRRWATAKAMQTALRVAVPGAATIEPLPPAVPPSDLRTSSLERGQLQAPPVSAAPDTSPDPKPSPAGESRTRPVLPLTPPASGRAWPPKPLSRPPIPLPSRASTAPPAIRRSSAPPASVAGSPRAGAPSSLPVTPRVDLSSLAAPLSGPTIVTSAGELDAPNTQPEHRAPSSDTMMEPAPPEAAAFSAEVVTPRADPPRHLLEDPDRTVEERYPDIQLPPPLLDDAPTDPQAHPHHRALPLADPPTVPNAPRLEVEEEVTLRKEPSLRAGAGAHPPEPSRKQEDSASSLSSLITSAPPLGPRTTPIRAVGPRPEVPPRHSSSPVLALPPSAPPGLAAYDPPRASWEPPSPTPARAAPPRIRRTHVYALIVLGGISLFLLFGLLVGSCLLLRR